MVQKHLICPQRKRKVPNQFSWLDHRLVRERYIDRISHRACALYLFLVTVSDAQGISYYSDRILSQRLAIDGLSEVRRELVNSDLIAYKKPLYQVLSLVGVPHTNQRQSNGQMESLGHILSRIREGVS